jgi:hypothetical protein
MPAIKRAKKRVAVMMIKATATGMKPFTTEELRQHIVATDAKFQKMPASLRRNSMESWPNSRAAIVREIQKREDLIEAQNECFGSSDYEHSFY